jgi:hypothetical protein
MLVNGGLDFWQRQLPNGNPIYRGCKFLFDLNERHYDWLVVYDDLASQSTERRSLRMEPLNCPKANTLLITSEPANIKSYGRAFTHQFGWILTSQPEWALPHPGRIYSQPALYWFYGSNHKISYDQMAQNPPLKKPETISTVCSNKQQKHTVHNQRYEFTHALKKQLPELEIFGRGIRPVEDKSEALNDYKYHIAIENFIGKHHWTEKLADAFLGGCLPFYYGCPNAADYFPPESFIPIDINNLAEAAQTIRQAIENNEYEKRLPHILEARRRVMEEYNIFSVLAREIPNPNNTEIPQNKNLLLSRRALRKRPTILIADLWDKAKLRILNSRNEQITKH